MHHRAFLLDSDKGNREGREMKGCSAKERITLVLAALTEPT